MAVDFKISPKLRNLFERFKSTSGGRSALGLFGSSSISQSLEIPRLCKVTSSNSGLGRANSPNFGGCVGPDLGEFASDASDASYDALAGQRLNRARTAASPLWLPIPVPRRCAAG